jgi:hypothetical protein
MTTNDHIHSDPTPSRRKFLAGAGAVAAAGVLAACGKSSKKSSSPTTNGSAKTGTTSTTTTTAPETSTTAAQGSASADLATATFAAGVEVLGVKYYTQALAAATAGKLGTVPPAVATYVQTAVTDHQAAADAWNKVLVAAGKPKVTEGPAGINAALAKQFAGVSDVTSAAKFALGVEQAAASTYLKAIPTLQDKAAVALASSIYPIDMQHVAVLRFVSGEYPVPDTFGMTDMALSPS